MIALKDIDLKNKDQVLERARHDIAFFMIFFLQEEFNLTLKIPFFHRALLAIASKQVAFLEDYGDLEQIVKTFPKQFYFNEEGKICLNSAKNTCVLIPRGFGKTLCMKAFILHAICFKLHDFMLLVSESERHTKALIRDIRGVLEGCERIKEYFGELQPPLRQRGSNTWSDEEINPLNGVFLVGRGRGGQVRGLTRKGNIRPSLVFLDDVEDMESVSTIEQRQKVRGWFFSELKPVLTAMDPNAGFITFGTLLHRDALLPSLGEQDDWVEIKLSAMNSDGELLWGEYRDKGFIENEKRNFLNAGVLDKFYLEYMSEIKSSESAIFLDENFQTRHYNREDFMVVALACDPAISQKRSADFCAYAVVGRTKDGHLHLLDLYHEKGMQPRAQVDKFFELSRKHQCTHHGVEAIAYQRALITMIQEDMFRRSHYFQVEPISHGTTAKEDRIRGTLSPRVASGYFSVPTKSGIFNDAIIQACEFPASKHDDLIDAISMAINLMEDYQFVTAPNWESPYQNDTVTHNICP